MSVVFFDVDGTILDKAHHRVVPSARSAIRRMRAKGHLAFLNTGRPLSTILPSVWEIGFDGVIAAYGTSIRYRGEVLREVQFPRERIQELTERLERHDLRVVLEGPEFVYVMDLQDGAYARDIRDYKARGMDVFRSWRGGEPQVNKFTYLSRFAPDFSPVEGWLSQDFTHLRYNDQLGDWVMRGHDKATGIQCVLERLGMEADDTYAFGDSLNDKAMMRYARYGVLMGDGDPDLKSICDYVTPPCVQDGVEDGLARFGLI